MILNPQTIKIFMHSMGLPKPLIALVDKLGAMGFGGFQMAPLPGDSPMWTHVQPPAPQLRCKQAYAARAANDDGRLTIVIFYEGVSDAAIEAIRDDVLALLPAAGAVAGAAPDHQ